MEMHLKSLLLLKLLAINKLCRAFDVIYEVENINVECAISIFLLVDILFEFYCDIVTKK